MNCISIYFIVIWTKSYKEFFTSHSEHNIIQIISKLMQK